MNEANNEVDVQLKARTWGLTDLNQDGTVNIIDISVVAMAFGTKEGDEYFNVLVDLDENNEVSILDISIVAMDYGKTV